MPPPLPPVRLPIDPDAAPISAEELAHDPGGDFRDDEVSGTDEDAGVDRERPKGDASADVALLPPD